MKRIVIIIAIVLVAAIGGWSALWFVNKSSAEDQMRQALATLDRAGVPNRFDAIEVSGFPFAYRGEVSNLTLDGEGGAITLPSVSAEVAIDAVRTVVFRMPERFEVLHKQTGERFDVVSEALEAQVALNGEDAYDLSMQADKLTVQSKTEGLVGPIVISELATSGELRADPEAGQVKLSLSMTAAESVQALRIAEEDGTVLTGQATTIAPKFDVEGSIQALSTRASAERLLMEFDGGGLLEVREPAYALTAKAKDQFDPAPLNGAGDFEQALQAFIEMAARGVANGGDFHAELTMASMQGSGAIEGRQNAADIGALSVALDFGAERVGMDFSGDKFLIDLGLPDDQGLYYAATEVKSTLSATPAEAFDFSPLTALGDDPDALGEALFNAIWGQVQLGGALEFDSSAGPSVTRAPSEPGLYPFGRIESEAGASRSRIAVNPEEAVLKVEVDGISYKVSEGFEGAASLKRLDIDFQSPLRSSPAEQKATLLVALDEVDLDDALWSLIDPDAALERDIKGLRLEAEAGVMIQRDLLSPGADLANLGNPALLPGEVTVSESFVDLLGLRAELGGALSVFPLPQGRFDLAVKGWRSFLDSVQKTPLGADPQTVSTLLVVNDQIVKYAPAAAEGAPEAEAETPDEVEFDIQLGPAGLLVNGKPYEG